MRFTTSGELRRVDLAPVLDLVPPLRSEWADLRFGPDGAVVHPMTGDPVPGLVLLEGRHRAPGARYRVTLPADEVSSEQRALLTLRRDDPRGIEGTVSAEDGRWSAEVALDHARYPAVRLDGTADLRAVLEDLPGWLRALVHRTATVTAGLDLLTLDRGGRLLSGEARVDRVDADLRLDVASSVAGWSVEGAGQVRGRGPARPLLWVFRSRVRDQVDAALERFWAQASRVADEAARGTADLQAAVDAAGGPETFVHRSLWDPDFDPEAAVRRPG